MRAMTGVTIQRELFGDCFEEAAPLLRRHWKEVAHYPDIELDPDVARYHALEASGALRVFTARMRKPEVGCGMLHPRLVGYAVFFVAPNAHYRSSLQAVQDVIYVDPEYRRGMVGLKLLRHCEDALRAEGVQAVYHHVKEKHPALGQILAHMGYEPVDVIYAKRLDTLSALEGKRVDVVADGRVEIWHEPAEVS